MSSWKGIQRLVVPLLYNPRHLLVLAGRHPVHLVGPLLESFVQGRTAFRIICPKLLPAFFKFQTAPGDRSCFSFSNQPCTLGGTPPLYTSSIPRTHAMLQQLQSSPTYTVTVYDQAFTIPMAFSARPFLALYSLIVSSQDRSPSPGSHLLLASVLSACLTCKKPSASYFCPCL